MTARLHRWSAGPSSADLDRVIARLTAADDVVHVAVMPDAHLAEEVCVGAVTATTRRLLPAAVGGDIGCGMLTVRLQGHARDVRDPARAAWILRDLARVVPPLVHSTRTAPALPAALAEPLSTPALTALAHREGRRELGTLGRGNHFLELQRDEAGELWAVVHSGSRCVGPAVRRHHEARGERDAAGLVGLDAASPSGRAYLADAAWAAAFAAENRRRVLARACDVLGDVLGVERADGGDEGAERADDGALADGSIADGAAGRAPTAPAPAPQPDGAARIGCDHNHVRHELHAGRWLWVHRKGAQRLGPGVLGIVPGSMGSSTFHVAGRDAPDALLSAAHGAGRALARGEARRRIRVGELDRQMRGVWFDARLRTALCEEAPAAYQDIGAVMRAQHELVRVVRRLTPVLVYKAV